MPLPSCLFSPCELAGSSLLVFCYSPVGSEGIQNKLLQNVTLWHVDYFEPKAIETQQI